MAVWEGFETSQTAAPKEKDAGYRRVWWCNQATSDDDATVQIYGAVPTVQGVTVLRSVNVKRVGQSLWMGEAEYGPPDDQPDPPATNEEEVSFDIGGGTQKVVKSIVDQQYWPEAGHPKFKRVIGVNKDKIDGVDILIPTFTLAITRYFPNNAITPTYFKTLGDTVGTVNDATFRGLPAKSVLLAGVSGSKRGRGDWKLDFKFSYSPNKTGITVDGITGIAKKGHQYLWVYYIPEYNADARMIVPKAQAVYVADVYEDGDFGALGISV